MNHLEISERFASMWRQSRYDAGKSQMYMARALGVSVKTVQNWEDGTSCPSQMKGFEWFKALDLPPLPYYLTLLYPDTFEKISSQSDDEIIAKALLTLVEDLPPNYKRKLLYFLYGDHGSDPMALMEMTNAYLQTPLINRINLASSIATNYAIAKKFGRIVQPDHIQPDLEVLKKAVTDAYESVMEGKSTYIVEKEND